MPVEGQAQTNIPRPELYLPVLVAVSHATCKRSICQCLLRLLSIPNLPWREDPLSGRRQGRRPRPDRYSGRQFHCPQAADEQDY